MTITKAEIDGFRDVGYFTTEVLFDASALDELKAEFPVVRDGAAVSPH